MAILLDDLLLEGFMQTFYGYGSFDGRFWFIGMEEGGGDSVEVMQRRLNAWRERGKLELEDLSETAAEMGAGEWFNERPRLQRTWGMLIRIALASEGPTPTTDEVREYQKISLGRRRGQLPVGIAAVALAVASALDLL